MEQVKYKQLDEWLIRFIIQPEYRPVRHVLLLTVVLIICIHTIYLEIPRSDSIWPNMILLVVFALPIYLNLFYLVPKLLYRNKVWSYVAGLIFILIISLLLALCSQYLANRNMIEKPEFYRLFVTVNIMSGSLSIILLSLGITAIMLFQQRIRYGLSIEELENQNMRSELEQLKNQVNPHFLFNMLNNANVLVHEDSDEARKVLVKLKDLLMYQFNESSKETVLLYNEIKFLTDYLNLESIRRDNFEYHINSDIDKQNHLRVPPMLFIPFVENAVKHGNDTRNKSRIMLSFRMANNRLYFNCINSKSGLSPDKNRSGGLGLVNIKRRLELLYGNNYDLKIEETNIEYRVKLELKL